MQKIAAKLVKVMKECGYVQKNGINDFHKYKYATCADVLEKVNAALTKHGIVSIATPELIQMQDVATNKGNTERLATVKLEILLVDTESGETVKLTGIGSGQDSGDKAVMKAQTAAIKYAYLLSLAISTGDDPEMETFADGKEAVQTSASQRQVRKDAIGTVCADCGATLSKGAVAVSTKKFGKALCVKCQKKIEKVA